MPSLFSAYPHLSTRDQEFVGKITETWKNDDKVIIGGSYFTYAYGEFRIRWLDHSVTEHHLREVCHVRPLHSGLVLGGLTVG